MKWLCMLKWVEIVTVCPIPEEFDADAAGEMRRIMKDNNLREGTIESVRGMEFDIGLSVNYHKIIPEDILLTCKKGFYNVHHSYNLRLRGRNITTHAILNYRKEGISYHGTTLHKMVPKLDAGPVVASAACEIEYTDTAYTLFQKADALALQLVREWFPRIACQTVYPYQPCDEGVHYYRNKDLPPKEIPMELLDSEEIYDYVRAFDFMGKEPAYVIINGLKRNLVLRERGGYREIIEVKGHCYYTD